LESASVPAERIRPSGGAQAWDLISKYGLIALLVAFPATYAISDVIHGDGLTRIADNLVSGISNGSIWALVALGYTLVYGIIELINFAHGEVFMIGSFVAFALYGEFGLTPETAALGLVVGLLAILVISMLASGILNVMVERVAYRPLRNAPKLAPLITAVGMSFILQNVGVLWLGASQVGIPDLIDAQKNLITIAGVGIDRSDVLAVVVTIPLVFALTTFVLIYALYQTNVWYFQGFTAGLIAFTAAVMGGIGNLRGAVIGGLIIGCIQQISDNRIGNEWTPAVVFAYLVIIMIFRPQGLIGEETREAG
jgi:branched-chain amino acid transport system permease protein